MFVLKCIIYICLHSFAIHWFFSRLHENCTQVLNDYLFNQSKNATEIPLNFRRMVRSQKFGRDPFMIWWNNKSTLVDGRRCDSTRGNSWVKTSGNKRGEYIAKSTNTKTIQKLRNLSISSYQLWFFLTVVIFYIIVAFSTGHTIYIYKWWSNSHDLECVSFAYHWTHQRWRPLHSLKLT